MMADMVVLQPEPDFPFHRSMMRRVVNLVVAHVPDKKPREKREHQGMRQHNEEDQIEKRRQG